METATETAVTSFITFNPDVLLDTSWFQLTPVNGPTALLGLLALFVLFYFVRVWVLKRKFRKGRIRLEETQREVSGLQEQLQISGEHVAQRHVAIAAALSDGFDRDAVIRALTYTVQFGQIRLDEDGNLPEGLTMEGLKQLGHLGCVRGDNELGFHPEPSEAGPIYDILAHRNIVPKLEGNTAVPVGLTQKTENKSWWKLWGN